MKLYFAFRVDYDNFKALVIADSLERAKEVAQADYLVQRERAIETYSSPADSEIEVYEELIASPLELQWETVGVRLEAETPEVVDTYVIREIELNESL
jgi:hypothetical protein